MKWEHLTGPEFKRAVRETGVCVFAMGCLEQHGTHLPIGTDFLIAQKIACAAAEKEPAVVFPPWYFAQIYEAKAYPGALTVRMPLMLELIEGVFDEIGRNGFRKIVVSNYHGGNRFLVPFLAQLSLAEEKPYSIYTQTESLTPERKKEWDTIIETTLHMHACECETSISLAVHPELVKTERIPKEPGKPLGRLKHLPQNFSGISWYGDYPDHFAGDPRAATAEKGHRLFGLMVDSLAEFIAAVKADTVVPALEDEFFKQAADPCGEGE